MWPFQNQVGIVGWIDQIYPTGETEDFVFRLLQPGYHERFTVAADQREGLLEVEVRSYGDKLSKQCRAYLKKGDRIQVYGRLISISVLEMNEWVGIEAWVIERAETLDSFRYFNHPWNYELKSRPPEGAVIPFPRGSSEKASQEGGIHS